MTNYCILNMFSYLEYHSVCVYIYHVSSCPNACSDSNLVSLLYLHPLLHAELLRKSNCFISMVVKVFTVQK